MSSENVRLEDCSWATPAFGVPRRRTRAGAHTTGLSNDQNWGRLFIMTRSCTQAGVRELLRLKLCDASPVRNEAEGMPSERWTITFGERMVALMVWLHLSLFPKGSSCV